MKKSKIILFLMTLFYNIASFSQTVTINSLTVNNVTVSSLVPINLGTKSITNISFSTEVILPSAPSDSYPGTINVYYQKNKTSMSLTPTGGNGGNLLFFGNKSTTRSFVITLDAAQFDLTGGFLYTEYKSYTGLMYKSSPIPIVKTTPLPPNFPPSDPNNAAQIVPYGGIPLLPPFVNYADKSSQNWVSGTPPIPVLTERNKWILYRSVDLKMQTIFNDGRIWYEPQKMSILVSNFFPNFSRLYVNNTINNNSNIYVASGQIPTVIVGNQASEQHSTTNGTVTNLLNKYQWQSRIIYPFWWDNFNYQLTLYGWKDIPGATQINYTPSAPATRGIEYRRLVLENPLDTSINRRSAASNVIAIYPININNIGNTICCDQTVYSNKNPNTIVGSTINSSSIGYIWEISLDGINWSGNIDGKDFTPLRSGGGGRPFVGTIKYRRLILDYSTNLYNISNVVTITYSNQTAKIKNIEKQDINLEDSIVLFPNPTSSIINIQGMNNLSPTKISIIDMEGKIIISREFNISTNSSIQLDISAFAAGIYSLELENENVKTTKKLIKK